MLYTSTRDPTVRVSFETAVLAGISSPDGGLFMPTSWPTLADVDKDDSFAALAARVVRLFVSHDELDDAALERIIARSCAAFEDPTAPVVLCESVAGPPGLVGVLELWHGPTLSFKDVAMQFVIQLQREFLERKQQRLTLLVATTGDTGASAIHAARSVPQVNCFVMYTRGRVTPRQELQMLSAPEPNVHAISVPCTSDDLDVVVRRLFAKRDLVERHALSTVNSFNWARVMYQIVYYVDAYRCWRRSHGDPSRILTFVVPTGGFGNGIAAVMAARLGLPIRVIGATNANDVLARIATGAPISAPLCTRHTLSSCMDIMIPSNLERLLALVDPNLPRTVMPNLAGTILPEAVRQRLSTMCTFETASDAQTRETIARVAHEARYVIDPHTAVAFHVAQHLHTPHIIVSTASPVKFIDTVTPLVPADLLPHDAMVDPAELAALRTSRALYAESIDETEQLLHRLLLMTSA